MYRISETYPKRVTIGGIFVPLRTHETLRIVISSAAFIRASAMMTLRFVSNAGKGFVKNNCFSYLGLLGSGPGTDAVVQPAGSNLQLVMHQDQSNMALALTTTS